MITEVAESFVGAPGTKESFSLKIGEMPNGMPYLVPVLVATGAEDGPTLFVNGAMHGDEPLSTAVISETWRALDPKKLRGRFLATPMANFAAVATRTRRNIIEMYPGPHDMNRVFPGDADGIITERIAALLMSKFVSAADYVFDVHTVTVGGEWEPYVAIPKEGDASAPADLIKRSRELGQAFGTRLIVEGHSVAGSLADAARQQGRAASMVEFGVANRILEKERELGRKGLAGIMGFAGMLDTSVSGQPRRQRVLSEVKRLKVNRGGLLRLFVDLMEDVTKGQPIGEVVGFDSGVVEHLVAPFDGVVCRVTTTAVVGTGDFYAFVGR